jgi:hypothetical protein
VADLKWLLDIDTKIRGSAAGVLERVDQSLKGLDGDLKKSATNFARLSTALTGVGRAARSGMNAAGGAVGGFARDALAHFTALASFNGLAALGRGAIDLGRNILDTAASAQRTESVFRALFGDAQGARLLSFADNVARSTEFDDGDIKRFIAGLGRAGVSADDMGKSLALALDIAGLTDGDPAAALNEVGAALERLRLKGEVDFRILKNIGIGEPAFLADLSKRTGKTVARLKKDIQAGKVEVDTIMAQIQASVSAKTGKASGAVGQERAGGATAVLNRLRNAPANLFEEFAQSTSFEPIVRKLSELGDKLAPDGPIGKQIIAGIDAVGSKLAVFLENVDVDKTLGEIKSFADSMIQVGRVVSTVVSAIATAFNFVGTFVGEFAAGVFLSVERLMGIGTAIGEALGSANVAVLNALDRVTGAVSGFFRKFMDKGRELGTAIWQGLRDGLLGGVRAVSDAMASLGTGMLERISTLLGWNSPPKVFVDLGKESGGAFASGLESTNARVAAAVDRTFQVPAPSRGFSGSGWSGAGQISVSVPITVNYNGAPGGGSDADEIAQRVSELVPAQLRAAFEDLRIELGG